MSRGNYVVIRYVADPARNEALNVGILLWDERGYRMQIDGDAAKRAVRDNKHLAGDALATLQMQLEADIADAASPSATAIERVGAWLGQQKGFPVSVSEPRLATLSEVGSTGVDPYDSALTHLLKRIVHPVRQNGPTSPARRSAIWQLRTALKPLLDTHKIVRLHEFESSGSGIRRKVDFFVNHGANTALEVFGVSRAGLGQTVQLADAEAFKIEDIMKANAALQMYVYLPSREQVQPQHPTEGRDHARRVLQSTGATLLTELEAARATLESATLR